MTDLQSTATLPAQLPTTGRRRRSGPRRVPISSVLGAVTVLAVLAASFVVPSVSRYTTTDFVADPLLAPSWQHLFGTDDIGRDLFVRTFAAGRVDIMLAVVGAGVALAIGTAVGVAVGMARNRFADTLLMRIVDAIIAFPGIVLILALVLVIGATTEFGPIPAGAPAVLIAVFVTHWAVFARLARTQTLVIRNSDFVQAANVLGYSRARIVFKHVLPNIAGPSIAYAITDAVRIIVATASLPFLGAGVQPPAPEWGNLMYEGRVYLANAWWIVLFPGIMLAVTGVGLALAAEGAAAWASPGRRRG